MSRTYRKNRRWFLKFEGDFYNPYTDKTIKGKSQNYTKYDWRKGCLIIDKTLHGANQFFEIVKVGDSENYSYTPPKGWKTMTHRIDRARYKQALYDNEDAYIYSSTDPWNWD